MTLPPLAPMTQEEYDAWCWTTGLRTEYVDGKVIVVDLDAQPDDGRRLFLGTLLQAFVDNQKLGRTQGPNFHARLRDGLRRLPDLVYVAHEHASSMRDSHLEGAPDLAVEFLSHSVVRGDRTRRSRDYQEAGVGEYWVVDTREALVEALARAEDGSYVPLPVEGHVLHSHVLPGFWIRLEWLLPGSRPTLTEALNALGVAL